MSGQETTGEILRQSQPGGGAASTATVELADYTAKGDILAGSAASAPTPLAVAGTAGYVLTVDPAEVTGLKWAAAPAGTPSGTAVAGTAYGLAAAAGTSAEYSRGDHSHGSVADIVSGTAHATLTAGIHGIAAGSAIATTAEIAAHALLTATHGAGTIASVAAATALITTHASSTDAHIGGAGTVLSLAAATVLITTHAGSTNAVHGVAAGSTIATTAEIATHAALTAGVHGVPAGSAIATTTAVTALITTHAGSTDAHIGGAGTVLSKAAATVLFVPFQMVENIPLWLDATISATGQYSGIAQTAVADAAASFGQLVYLKSGSTRWALAGAGTGMSNRLGMVITAATGAAQTIAVLTYGNISSTTFPALTVGSPIYGGVPAGTISGTAAGTATQYVRVIGHANSSTEIHFSPAGTWIELA